MRNERENGGVDGKKSVGVERVFLYNLSPEKFLTVHSRCGTSLVAEMFNSDKANPSSVDLSSIRVFKYHCVIHHISSAPAKEQLEV